MHLVTGYAGEEHIKSRDDGAFNAAFFGADQFVMESGNQFEASIIDNNTVRVLDGDLLMYGRHALIEPLKYEDITIKTGTAGKNRIDLIVVRYEKNTNDGTESTYLEVIQGTEAEIGAVPPEYTDGNILEGATMNQMPLYQVAINGVVLTSVTPLFVTKPSYQALAAKYEEEFKSACKTHLDSLNVLDSMEEIEANTQEKQLAGALALKEMNIRVQAIKGVILAGTLTAGETTLTLTDASITEDSTFIDLCTTIWGVNPTEAPVVANGSITYKFDAQSTDMGVKVRCL